MGVLFFRNLFLNIDKEELTEEPTNGHHGVWKDFPYNNEQVSHSVHLVRNPYTRVVSMFTFVKVEQNIILTITP